MIFICFSVIEQISDHKISLKFCLYNAMYACSQLKTYTGAPRSFITLNILILNILYLLKFKGCYIKQDKGHLVQKLL